VPREGGQELPVAFRGESVIRCLAVKDLEADIRSKIAAGTLPAHSDDGAEKLWVGKGNGRPCDVCGDPITAAEREYEIDLASGSTLRFHGKCLAAWHDARA
jgi:hypothetical protein